MALQLKIKDFLSYALSIFFPFHCHICDKPIGSSSVVCPECSDEIRHSGFSLMRVSDVRCNYAIWTAGDYSGKLSNAIKIMKYRPSKRIWKHIIPFLEKALKSGNLSADVIIPVPIHAERERKRGFNQAEIIARETARLLNSNYSPLLERVFPTTPQAGLSETDRKINLIKCFSD
ncbi:MAG: ComF family protein [Candidatus Riflebacteria bacterium]|nr:ComF family protein [Candidatus Riflebacteria bacterium]